MQTFNIWGAKFTQVAISRFNQHENHTLPLIEQEEDVVYLVF